MRRAQQAINHFFVGISRAIVDKSVHFLGVWRQTEQIVVQAADKGVAIGRRGGRNAGGFQLRKNELVDRITNPPGIFNLGRVYFAQRTVSPVDAPFGTGANPLAQESLLFG